MVPWLLPWTNILGERGTRGGKAPGKLHPGRYGHLPAHRGAGECPKAPAAVWNEATEGLAAVFGFWPGHRKGLPRDDEVQGIAVSYRPVRIF